MIKKQIASVDGPYTHMPYRILEWYDILGTETIFYTVQSLSDDMYWSDTGYEYDTIHEAREFIINHDNALDLDRAERKTGVQ